MTSNPKRHLEMTIDIGADSVNDLCGMVRQLEFELASRQEEIAVSGLQITTGGWGYGGAITVKVNADVTHDSYFAAVDEWLAERKEAEQAAASRDDAPQDATP